MSALRPGAGNPIEMETGRHLRAGGPESVDEFLGRRLAYANAGWRQACTRPGINVFR